MKSRRVNFLNNIKFERQKLFSPRWSDDHLLQTFFGTQFTTLKMRRLFAAFLNGTIFFLRNRFTTTNLSSVRMATNVTNANMAVIQNIDDAVKRRDYSWLESNADLLRKQIKNKFDLNIFFN
jgi:hypothetical protein